MFSILRFILIVGAIFYFSPVRQNGEGTAALEAFLTPKKTGAVPATAAPDATPDRLESMWKALPESAQQAVIDKILTTSGLSASPPKATDTLQPSDRHPALRAEATKPRT